MKEILEVFRACELTLEIRISVIKKLGSAMNFQLASNWTDEIVEELTSILQKDIVERDKQPF